MEGKRGEGGGGVGGNLDQCCGRAVAASTEEGWELWPQIPSRSIFLLPKAPSAWVMAARQVLSEVVPQEMRDRGAERPTEL